MATIKDVARLAGVGLGTASRVVSGKGSVAPATARRVHKAIEQLNFRPSHAARALLSGSSQMIGVYIPILKGTFYTPVLQTIDGALREGGRHPPLRAPLRRFRDAAEADEAERRLVPGLPERTVTST